MVLVQDGINCSIEDAINGKFTYPETKKDNDGNETIEDKPITFSKLNELAGGCLSDDGNYILQFGSIPNLVINKVQTVNNKNQGQKIVNTKQQEETIQPQVVTDDNEGRGSRRRRSF